jgi:ribosome-associated heat shock protein Hsp15
MTDSDARNAIRFDKWLWAARLFKTRSLAADAVERGHVRIDDQRIKPARIARLGDRVVVQRGDERIEFIVRGLSGLRGPAAVAQQLYEETPESRVRREQTSVQRRLARDPAAMIKGRPSKRDARALRRMTGTSDTDR